MENSIIGIPGDVDEKMYTHTHTAHSNLGLKSFSVKLIIFLRTRQDHSNDISTYFKYVLYIGANLTHS